MYDAIIVGGGAAGLSAALVLGRARRVVLVIDDARPRNAVADRSHGFTTRDGVPPAELLRLARAELAAYPTVTFVGDAAIGARKSDGVFTLAASSGRTFAARRLLLATGVFDVLPEVRGLTERWGKSVFVCPFCDGWEVRDRRIAVHGKGREAVELAQELRGWTGDLVVCADRDDLTVADRRWIEAAHAVLKIGRLTALSGPDLSPFALTFEDGDELTCQALFITAPLRQHSPLFAELGCQLSADSSIAVDVNGQTTVEGCYAAGDAVSKRHQIVISAAGGANAAIAMSGDLLEEEANTLTQDAAR